MKKLTKRQEEIMLALIRKEILSIELTLGGAIEIMTCSNYLAELIALRAAVADRK